MTPFPASSHHGGGDGRGDIGYCGASMETIETMTPLSMTAGNGVGTDAATNQLNFELSFPAAADCERMVRCYTIGRFEFEHHSGAKMLPWVKMGLKMFPCPELTPAGDNYLEPLSCSLSLLEPIRVLGATI